MTRRDPTPPADASASRSLRQVQAFFAPRAAGWDERFAGDEPRFARAVAELAPAPGACVLDAGCGTGRALPPLRAAVGPRGRVLGLDATPEMLAAARRHGRDAVAALVLGDAGRLPIAAGVCDAVFAAGLLPHLEDAPAGLRELARITRPGGRLALFHPIGRAALAARHQRVAADDDVNAPGRLTTLLDQAGWAVETIEDGADRFLALATRRPPLASGPPKASRPSG